MNIQLLLVAALALPGLAWAQPGAQGSDLRRIQILEREVDRLQRHVLNLDDRLRRLEGGGYLPPGDGRPWPNPPGNHNVLHACMIVESGFATTYLGTGRTQIDAEYNAVQSCNKGSMSSNCVGSRRLLKCDNNFDNRSRGYVCTVQVKGFGGVYRGEGATAVMAEANAKMACQKNTMAINCGHTTARCEEVY
jgi:hypothetical protein